MKMKRNKGRQAIRMKLRRKRFAGIDSEAEQKEEKIQEPLKERALKQTAELGKDRGKATPPEKKLKKPQIRKKKKGDN